MLDLSLVGIVPVLIFIFVLVAGASVEDSNNFAPESSLFPILSGFALTGLLLSACRGSRCLTRLVCREHASGLVDRRCRGRLGSEDFLEDASLIGVVAGFLWFGALDEG